MTLTLQTGNDGTHAPIIVTGTTDSGMRWAQLWHPEHKIVLSLPASPYCMAWMRSGEGQIFGIDGDCPPEWVDIALGMFDAFRKGGTITPTHVQSWKFGQPTFAPVVVAPVTDAVLELDLGVTL